MGASFIIGVESDPVRMKMSKQMGADVVLDPKQCDVVAEIKKLTARRRGCGDRSARAPGNIRKLSALPASRRDAEQSRRLLGKTSGAVRRVRCRHRRLQNRDHTLPGREGTDAPLDVDGANETVRSTPLLTHSFKLDQIVEAYELFGSRREGCLKVAIRP